MTITTTSVSTDVLIVGSGSAGAMAAVKAQMAGADVLVVTKGPYPSGNTTKAAAGYAAAFGHADARDNTEVHFGDVVRNGIGLCNEVMVKTWVDSICALTDEMREWGIDLIFDGDKYLQRPWEGHTYPRMVHHHWTTGKYLMKCLGAKAEEMNLKALSHTMIGGLFKDGERVSGAWGVNYRTGEAYIIRAKAVIMTTGGYGSLYPVGDNVGAATGEGYAIAFDAGAEMLGMEFGHYLPTPIYPEKMKIKSVFAGYANGLVNEAGAKLRNNEGREFFYDKFPETGATKLKMEELTRYIGEENLKGGGGPHGGVFFDVSDVPEEFKSNPRYSRVWQLAGRAGYDLRADPIELVCYPHDLVGGIKITIDGETNVPGLYAAGEATGGSHGASRFGGSALSDCLVFGARGAVKAAGEAAKLNTHPSIAKADIAAVGDKLAGWTEREEGVDPGEILDRNSHIANTCLNVVRSEDSIRQAYSELDDIEANAIPDMSAAGADDKDTAGKIRQAIEAEGQITLCRLLGAASLERTESRGGYFGGAYRLEYPDQDDENWLKNVVLRKQNGGIAVSHDAVVKLPGGYTPAMKKAMSTEWSTPEGEEEDYSVTE